MATMVDSLCADAEWDPELAQPGVSVRLKSRFTVWLADAKWAEFGAKRRPSGGYPFEADVIMERRQCGLGRGLANSSLKIGCEMEPTSPELLAAACQHTPAASFVPVWSRYDKEVATVLNVSKAVDTSLAVYTACTEKLYAEAKKKQK